MTKDEAIAQMFASRAKVLENESGENITALLADQAALRAEVEALKSDNDSYREAANGYLAEVEALEREVEALRAERDQLAEFVIAVGGFWGHSKSKLVGESSLAEVINRSIEEEDALRKDAECFRLLKARMGAAIDAALAQAKEQPNERTIRDTFSPLDSA